MTGIFIEFNAQPTIDALRRAADAIEHPEPLFRGIGEYLLISHRARWGLQVSPDGVPWAPLSPRYKTRKDKERPGRPLLVFDNLLLGTLRYQADDSQLLFGTDRPYGARQHFGGGGITARPWLGVSNEDDATILAMTHDFIQSATDGDGKQFG